MPMGLPEALRYLAPRIASLAGQALQPLQALPSRSAPSLAEELAGMNPAEALAFLGRDWARLGTTQEMGIAEAVALGRLVERFSDHFFSLYHRVFDWLSETAGYMDQMGWQVHSFDHEDANSQFEFDFAYADILTMADRYVLCRLMMKEIARKHGFESAKEELIEAL